MLVIVFVELPRRGGSSDGVHKVPYHERQP